MNQAELAREIREAVAEVRPLEAARIQGTSGPDLVHQFDLRTDTIRTVAHFAITAGTLNDAINLNGRTNLYNGPILYRIQCAVERRLTQALDVDLVRLQVLGPDGGIPIPELQESRHIENVSLSTAWELGIIRRDGEVSKCCAEYGLSSVLLLNGQIIGPSPDLALTVGALVPNLVSATHGEIRVYDPFAGTHLVSALLERSRLPAVVEAQDRLGTDGERTYYDAFRDVPDDHFDMVIVDPLFEDVLGYLTQCVPRLKFEYLIVESGNMADIAWNHKARELLDSLGEREEEFERAGEFGKCIYVYKRK